MRGQLMRAAVMGAVLLTCRPAAAADPDPAETLPAPRPVAPDTLPAPRRIVPDTLPAPRQIVPEGPPAFVHYGYPGGYQRVSRYAVWDNYAVDRNGYFKPRVVLSPYGAYYRYNGAPFPWTATRQMDFLPSYSNQAVFPPPVMPYADD